MTKLPAIWLLAMVGCLALGAAEARAAAPGSQPLTVVELFQSQGCSSCPPAEANLNAIAGEPGILALSFGVTYWDSLGWKDTFASKAYTDRQWDYARHRHRNNVWTPQVYVDGDRDLVGSDRAKLNQAIASAHVQGPPVHWGNGKVQVGEANRPDEPCDVWLVRYDPRTVNVAIRAGENDGRTLPHRNVVHQLVKLGRWNGRPRSFDLPAAPMSGLSDALLVQLPSGGAIVGAGKAYAHVR